MNWKTLILSVVFINIIAWAMLELWISRYSGGVAEIGAGLLVSCQGVGYYILAVNSNAKEIVKEKSTIILPQDCPEHDWQTAEDSSTYQRKEECVICHAKRGVH